MTMQACPVFPESVNLQMVCSTFRWWTFSELIPRSSGFYSKGKKTQVSRPMMSFLPWLTVCVCVFFQYTRTGPLSVPSLSQVWPHGQQGPDGLGAGLGGWQGMWGAKTSSLALSHRARQSEHQPPGQTLAANLQVSSPSSLPIAPSWRHLFCLQA